MNVKYQIFVSSTYKDLKDERNEVVKACLNMGHIPVGMEMFNAADDEQWLVIKRTIKQCEYYIVIVAHCYGSITPGSISFTEREYDYAVEQGVPVLGFIIAEDAPWPNTKKECQQDALKKLGHFKAKVKRKMVRFWHNAPELRAQVVESLDNIIKTRPRRGWTPIPEPGALDDAQTLSNLTEENARLRRTLEEIRAKDELNDIMELLTHKIDNRSGREFFSDLVASSDAGEFSNPYENWVNLSEPPEDAERRKVFTKALKDLGRWGLIERSERPWGWKITPLGQKVYYRLELEKRSSSPS